MIEYDLKEALGYVTNPEWEKVTKVHDWRNHITDRVYGIWYTFSDAQKLVLILDAMNEADREYWD